MLIFKALGATCMAGALAASGVITSDHLATHRPNDDRAAATLAADPHASFEALAVGEEKQVPADDAGSATVKRTSTRLEVSAMSPAAGWTASTKTLAPDWVLISFESPGRKVDLSLDIVGGNLRIRTAAFDVEVSTTTTTEAPTTTSTSPPPPATTPTTPATITLPPPVQPTVIPVAGAGTVVIVLQGPIVVVRDVKVVPGWVATVERRSGDIDVLFRRGDRSFRFFASMADRSLTSGIREVRADGDHRVGFDARDGDFHRDDH